jgi:hypothetical protein
MIERSLLLIVPPAVNTEDTKDTNKYEDFVVTSCRRGLFVFATAKP